MSAPRPKPPPQWARNAVSFVLRDATSRARAGTLRHIFTVGTPAGVALCALIRSEQGIEVLILLRPRRDYLANTLVAHVNGETPKLVASWQQLCEAIAIVEARSARNNIYSAATPEAARDLARLPSAGTLDVDEVIRMFADAMVKRNEEMAA